MRKNNVIEMNVATKDNNMTTEMFQQILTSAIKVGNKTFAYVPLRLMYIDEAYQRQTSKAKVRKLAEKWNINKMDALRVAPHPETGMFSIIDGQHRYSAAKLNGEKFLASEIIMGLSDDPAVREKQEAKLFSTQGDEVNHLTPQEKHKANILLGVEENIVLDNLCKKYNIALKPDTARGKVRKGVLSGFVEAIRIIKSYGEDVMDETFYILCECRWNLERKGMGNAVLRSVSGLLALHPDHKAELKQEIAEYFRPITPEKFMADAMNRYPERKEQERLVMYLEDEMVCQINDMYRVYTGGPVTSYLKAI